ncbi:MAG: hypothetical protein K8F27_14745 [Sulfuricellaceae bacterium]|nr:hypothetical protein [Sulfuricellaceae bacterium]
MDMVFKRKNEAKLTLMAKEANLIISPASDEDAINGENLKSGFVLASSVKNLNSSLKQPEYKTILRESLASAGEDCPKVIYDGKGGWMGLDWFASQPTYEACMKVCEKNSISPQHCPCNALFNIGQE